MGVPLTQETTDSTTSGADAQLAAAQANYDKSKFTYEKDSTAELAMHAPTWRRSKPTTIAPRRTWPA